MLELRVRTEQQTPEWKTRYAVRSGVEGTVNEFAHGHGMRRCRYRGQDKAHVQHVLTAIAVNIERLSGLPPTREAPPTPPADRLPELPRSARDPPAEVLAIHQQLTAAKPRSPTAAPSYVFRSLVRPTGETAAPGQWNRSFRTRPMTL
ncbi:transposase [Actinacidiphila oryziradicis]|uniref:Transposase DDE domain-containing protein n=1 Tax=Actinacidiphila oryziradicis TaxID=2571141 RepID=A0A4U0S4Z7_9ACTN|nr:transposase [Actinacidiphila oryziradicis]TKA02121.1 hypothetical protein FCI23_38905 [Actinacidiphila oryziradicis]